MPPNTLAPVPDVWRVAMVAGAGAVLRCAVWIEGGIDACGTSVYGVLICTKCHPPADEALAVGWVDEEQCRRECSPARITINHEERA
jgi:hypothetical protein